MHFAKYISHCHEYGRKARSLYVMDLFPFLVQRTSNIVFNVIAVVNNIESEKVNALRSLHYIQVLLPVFISSDGDYSNFKWLIRIRETHMRYSAFKLKWKLCKLLHAGADPDATFEQNIKVFNHIFNSVSHHF